MDENLSKNKISERNQKRNFSLSPLFTGDEMGIFNYLCISFGFTATVLFAYFGNEILKVKLK